MMCGIIDSKWKGLRQHAIPPKLPWGTIAQWGSDAGMRTLILVAIIIVALAALLWVLNSAYPNVLADSQNRVQIFAMLGWLVLLAGGVVVRFRSNPGSALRSLAAWLLIALVLVWIYAYRFEAQQIGNRILAVLLPSHGIVSTDNLQTDGTAGDAASGEVRFALNQYGHYQIDARVNGVYVTFIVDTGASDVVLSPDDARRIGLADNQLNFSQRVETANGVGYAAPVTLNNIAIGPITVNRLPAMVNQAQMGYSLLGMRFLNKLHGWRVEVDSVSEGEVGGYKEIIASITGDGVFGRMKFESGVHRVQRVPDTETQGRIHTSAATVAVLPEVEDVDIVINDADIRIDTYRSSGAGGQHVNKTDSAVRITHLPSGIVVTSSEKSQHQNRARAMKVLQARLHQQKRDALDAQRSEARKSQVGSGDRSERIRTYNFPQGRVTDHRINLTLYNLSKIIAGDALSEIVDALVAQDQADRLAEFEAAEA